MARPKGMPKTGGRKRGTPNRATAEVRVLAGQYTEDAVTTLVDIMRDEKQPAVARVSAANGLLDRAHGKPPQAVVTAEVPYSGPLTVSTAVEAAEAYMAIMGGRRDIQSVRFEPSPKSSDSTTNVASAEIAAPARSDAPAIAKVPTVERAVPSPAPLPLQPPSEQPAAKLRRALEGRAPPPPDPQVLTLDGTPALALKRAEHEARNEAANERLRAALRVRDQKLQAGEL